MNELFFGTLKGKIKIGYTKKHKSHTLYSTNSFVVNLKSGINGKYLVSGHIDGSIYVYNMET